MFKKGDKVIPNPEFADRMPSGVLGRVFTVEKVNPKNLKCSADDGGRGINFPASILKAYDPNVPLANQIGRPFRALEFFSEGEIVSLKSAWRDWSVDTPLVVIKQTDLKVNVVPVGGTSNGVYLSIPSSGLVKRDKMWLAERLLEEDAS